MAVISSTCPHCTAKSQLKVIGFYVWADKTTVFVSLGAICPGCQRPSSALAVAKGALAATPDAQRTQLLQHMVASPTPIEAHNLLLIDLWPKAIGPQIPDHLPDGVRKAFLQAENNFPITGHEEAAAMMYRRSLELGLSAKYPDEKGSLKQTIDSLVAKHVLTEDLGKWATDVRLLGNEAAHDEGVSRDELVMMRGFADAVLRYTWTLPEQVKLRRAAADIPPKQNAGGN